MKNVVVIGGGHGQSTMLRGLKDLDNINLSTIVTVADDGGSTGRIRNIYNIPAMGDIRNVLMALSSDESLLGKLMNYRFAGEDEEDIVGHSLGNLILTATTQMSGSFSESIELLSKELHVKAKIIPSSLEVITLYAKMDDGTMVKGEANIPSFTHHISEVFYRRFIDADKEAIDAIMEADYIIYGIGSLYTSILANTIIPGITDALNKTKAKKIYFANCMTQPNETFEYDLKDHVEAFRKHKTPVDMVIKHSDIIPEHILNRYKDTNSIEVIYHGDLDIPVIERKLLNFSKDLVRHDPVLIKEAVEELIR